MMAILILIFFSILGSTSIIFLIQQRRISNFYQELYKLRLNTLNNSQYKLKICHNAQLNLGKEVYEIIKRFHVFNKRCQELSQKDRATEQGDKKLRIIDKNLTQELSKILDQNYALRETMAKLEKEYKKIGTLMVKNFKLRLWNDKLEAINKRIKDINMDLEYAINLTSISMIESYQPKNKLFSAIDDVRRSLINILDPA